MNKWIAALSFCFFLTPAIAHDSKPEGLVSLQASASIELETDTMFATIAVEAENYDPAALAKSINKKMAWALETAEAFKHVKVKGGQYSSHQIYNKHIFKAWRGSQRITLESTNSTELGQLIGLLQKQLLVKSISYQVSKEKVNSVKDRLLTQAITRFKQKATLVSEQFNKSSYRIHAININSNNPQRPVHYASSRMMGDSAMSKSAPANLQQNSRNIQLNINGTIRLID